MAAFSDTAFAVTGFSESAFDFGTGPVVVPVDPSAGWYNDHELYRRNRRRREAEQQERERESQDIQNELDRKIALLLREQEAKDAERDDLARIQRLADQYAGKGSKIGLPKQVSIAMLKAYEERTRNALEQMRRELERMADEEEMAVIQALLLDD